jgi:hypothetical protein
MSFNKFHIKGELCFEIDINIFCIQIFVIRPIHLCSILAFFYISLHFMISSIEYSTIFFIGFYSLGHCYYMILKLIFVFIKPISNFPIIFQNTKNKMKQISVLLTFFFTFFTTIHSAYNSTGPTWLPSPYFRAGNNRVITTKTAAGQQTYYTFTFSSALSGIPNLAYGVKNYRGKQSFKCRMRYDDDRKF